MKTAIYTRISADQTGEGLGVARQLEDCTALAQRLGWDIVQIYTDNDISAYNGKRRPGFEALLAGMKGGRFAGLICWHVDRLYRSMKDLERLIEIADAAGVAIRTVNGGDLDLSTSAGRMVARILGSVARQESEHSSERRKRANTQKAAAGRWATAIRPFGYTIDGQPLEPEASAVRKAVADVLAGKSIRRVAMEWNAQGLTTTRGTAFNGPAVRRLLAKPRYAGLRTYQGKVVDGVKGDWPALIDEDTHRGLVAFLSDPSRIIHTSFERKYQGSGVYRCGVCGGPMKAAAPGKRCSRAYACRRGSHVVRQGERLDEFVSMLVIERLSRPDVALKLDDGTVVDVAGLQARRIALQARMDELAEQFANGDIDGSQLRRGTSTLRSKMTALDAELADAVRISPLADFVASGGQIAQRWEETTPDKRGKIIDQLMTVSVLPAPRGGRNGFDPEFIRIDWKTP